MGTMPRSRLRRRWRSSTRATVELVLEKLAGGETVEQILSEHPWLTEEGVRAVIAFAA